MRFSVLVIIVFVQAITALGQNSKFDNAIFKSSIKTLKTFVDGNDRSYPAIELFGDNVILIQFDDLSPNANNYSYRIIHCNYDWTASELFLDEFMEGFNENSISNYDFSINTKVPYVNYWVAIPNDDVQLKKSGNYVLSVFEDGDQEKIVLTARFVVYESLLDINAEIIRPLGAQVQNNSQEIKLSVNHEELEISDPFNEVKVVISQNNRPDRIIKDIKPVFVKNNELVYSFSGENIFKAGNEFRAFGFTNTQKYGLNVNDIQFADTIYHVQLRLDERRSSKHYFWEEEMNGKSFIYLDNSLDSYVSADYAYVYFSLPIDDPFLDGKLYLYGDMTYWQTNEQYQMQYNFDTKMYEAKLLLKQGYYNYMYTCSNNYTGELDDSFLEGSHYQTENDYVIYIYQRNFSDNYDRLVGYQVINSKYQE
ncbi:MAG: DUF5103 domain-containing protein [Salinivirgaceae bacterium]|jgi:hypothetical protein|nr:DUF5103 domain-containing protein [Salinivirgaceae bacterium]